MVLRQVFVQLLSLFGQQVALFRAVFGGGSGQDGRGIQLLPINVGFLIQVLDFNYLFVLLVVILFFLVVILFFDRLVNGMLGLSFHGTNPG